jgi:flagella basal body P-ring formation protein FlgA
MKRFTLLLLLSFFAMTAIAESLQLKERHVCEKAEVRLGDLLYEGNLAPNAERVMCEAPKPGTAVSMSRARLQRRLWDMGWRGNLEGPETLRIETPSVTLSMAPLMETVKAQLSDQLEKDGLRLEGEIKGWVESIRLSDSRIRWNLELRGKPGFRNRSASLQIEDSKGFQESILLRFHCRMPLIVAVAISDLKEGESLKDWEYAEHDGFFLDGDPLDPEVLQDAVSKRKIEKGSPLTTRNLRAGLLVREGREVEIHLSRGPVTVTLMGVAQADGALGERVSVRHMDSGELHRYRVTGEGRVSPSYVNLEEESS